VIPIFIVAQKVVFSKGKVISYRKQIKLPKNWGKMKPLKKCIFDTPKPKIIVPKGVSKEELNYLLDWAYGEIKQYQQFIKEVVKQLNK
jgi:hypothetical protein